MQPASLPKCGKLTGNKRCCLPIVQVLGGRRRQPLALLILKGHALSMEQRPTPPLNPTHLRIGDVKWV